MSFYHIILASNQMDYFIFTNKLTLENQLLTTYNLRSINLRILLAGGGRETKFSHKLEEYSRK